MLPSILVVTLSILWLIHRTTRLLKVPAPALIHVLGIDVPDIPQVSVDNVTSTTVQFHWSPADKNSNVVKFLVEVENFRIGELDRNDTNVVVKDLDPNQSYTIRVVAVNASNYRSHASTVWIHTKKSSEESLPSSVNLRGIRGVDEHSASISLYPKNNLLHTSTSKSNLRNRATSKSTKRDNADNHSRHNNKNKVYTVESLTQEVESAQIEINDLLAQAAQAESEFTEAERVLLNELEQFRESKRQEDLLRSSVRLESKSLEDSRRGLEKQKLKAEKDLERLQNDLDHKTSLMEQWSLDLDKFSKNAEEFETSRANLIEEFTISHDALRSEIDNLQNELFKLEEETKCLGSETKRIEAKQQKMSECIALIQDSTDPITGLIKDECLESVGTNFELEDLLQILKTELEIEKDLEAQWQKTQKDLEVRYLHVSKQYQEAEKSYKSAISSAYNGTNTMNTPLDALNAAASAALPKTRRKTRSKKSTDRGLNLSQINPTNSPQLGESLESNDSNTHLSTVPFIDTSSSSMASRVMDNDDILMSPSVDMLLPSNLLGADDLNESFSQLLNDLPRRATETSFDELPPALTSERPSASILAGVFSSKRNSFNDSDKSHKPSSLSLMEAADGQSLGSHSPALPSSPHSSGFASFSSTLPPNSGMSVLNGPFSNNGTSVVDNADVASIEGAFSGDDDKRRISGSRKLSNLFVFGKPRSNTGNGTSLFFRRNGDRNDIQIPAMDESIIPFPGSERPTSDVGPIGTRPRAGSYGSMASGISNNNNLLNPWIDSGLESNPNGFLRPSQSNSGSMRSLDVKTPSAFNTNWSVFDQRPSEADPRTVDASYDSFEANWKGGMPMLLLSDSHSTPLKHENSNNSVDSKTSSSGTGSKFSKGWSGLFSSSEKNSNEKLKGDQKSIASLFGKSDDDHEALSTSLDSAELATKENILQKSMRTFTGGGGRKSSSSTSSSKFVRKLNLFGKRGELRDTDSEPIQPLDGSILEESSSIEPIIDYQTFLSSVEREVSN